MVRTRFAPSPTGYMHVGGVRTALFAWLVARQSNGHFLLRIEDTDRKRHVPEAEQHILESLKWLGLDWDGEIYHQSKKLDVYKEWAHKLIDKGRAYVDPLNEDDLGRLRQQAKKAKKPFKYRDFRPPDSQTWDSSQPLRFKSEPKRYEWHDEVMGEQSVGADAIDDFVLMKTDGYPTYDFAHIIDDHLMGITHVMRSQEFAPSIPKYLNLYEALEIERPVLATLPYVLAPDGKKKLSKREGARDVLSYKREGFLPEALINFLAKLGWNDGSEKEIFSVSELISEFSLERVQRSGAHFDEKRLLWMNGHYIRQLNLDDLGHRVKDFWPVEADSADEDYKKSILSLFQERLKFFGELGELSKFFFMDPPSSAVKELMYNPPDKQLSKLDSSNYAPYLKTVEAELSDSDFSEADITSKLNALLEKLETKPGVLFALVRIAISGEKSTPDLFGTLSVLGKEKSLSRIKRALNSLEAQAK